MSYHQLTGRAPLPVNQIGVQLRTIKTQFAPQKRGRPSFKLQLPTVVNAPPSTTYPQVFSTLAPQSRRPSRSLVLSRPQIINAQVLNLFGVVYVTLAPQSVRPGLVRKLSVPTVVNAPVLNLFGVVYVTLAPQSRRPGQTKLRPPAVVAAAPLNLFGVVNITLAPQSRPRPDVRSTFVFPIVVTAAPNALGQTAISLTRRPRPATIAVLGAPPSSNTIRALHLKSTTGLNDIYARKNVSLTDLWVRVHVKWLADLPGDNQFTGAVVSLDDAGGNTNADGWYIGFPTGQSKQWFGWWQNESGFTTPAIVTNQWYMVDLHYATGTPTTDAFWIDNVDKGITNSHNDTNTVTSLSFGNVWFGSWQTNYEMYIANIKVGTSRGASDIWAPTLASLADFDSTVNPDGILEVVSVQGP